MLVYGILLYQKLVIFISDGVNGVVSTCQKKKITLPTWAPPCCLFPFLPTVEVTARNLSFITTVPMFLLSIKIFNMIIQIIGGVSTDLSFESFEGIITTISLLLTIFTIYNFTMFNIIIENVLEGDKRRFLGVLLLVEYILFDSQRGFFKLLSGKY